MKVYIHQRDDQDSCTYGWAEYDTQALDEVRHECDEPGPHLDLGRAWHVCTCGLVDDVA